MKVETLSQHIYRIFKEKIEAGIMKPGDFLPALPALAEQQKASISTVRHALEDLAEDGFIEKKSGIGTYVADRGTSLRGLRVATVLNNNTYGAGEFGASFSIQLKLRGAVPVSPESDYEALCIFGSPEELHIPILSVQNAGKPVAAVTDGICSIPVSTVISDWDWGMYALMEHLIREGHREIALISMNSPRGRSGEKAYLRTASESKLDLTENDIYRINAEQGDFEELRALAAQASVKMIRQGRYTAAIGVRDSLAAGVMDSLIGEGFSIPEDFSVAGIDNDPIARRNLDMTSVDRDSDSCARAVCDLLARIRAGKNKGPECRMIRPKIILRSSSRNLHDIQP